MNSLILLEQPDWYRYSNPLFYKKALPFRTNFTRLLRGRSDTTGSVSTRFSCVPASTFYLLRLWGFLCCCWFFYLLL